MSIHTPNQQDNRKQASDVSPCTAPTAQGSASTVSRHSATYSCTAAAPAVEVAAAASTLPPAAAAAAAGTATDGSCCCSSSASRLIAAGDLPDASTAARAASTASDGLSDSTRLWHSSRLGREAAGYTSSALCTGRQQQQRSLLATANHVQLFTSSASAGMRQQLRPSAAAGAGGTDQCKGRCVSSVLEASRHSASPVHSNYFICISACSNALAVWTAAQQSQEE
jgi:hypothetical protein